MAEEKKTVSPEEKLLKVIQEDGKQAPKPAPAEKTPVAAEAAKTPAASKPAAPAKPLPKMKPAAPVEKKAPAPAAAGKPADDKTAKPEQRPSKPMIGAAPAPSAASAAPQKRKRKESFNLAIINHGLAALIVVALFFAGMEIYGAVRSDKAEGGPIVPPDTISGIQAAGTVSFADARKAWVPSPWGPIGDGPGPEGTNAPPPPTEDWMKWVKDNWKLMGISRTDVREKWEIVIHDGEKKGLLFMKIGDVLKVQNADVKLDSIEDDRIRLHDGKKGMDLK